MDWRENSRGKSERFFCSAQAWNVERIVSGKRLIVKAEKGLN